MFLQELKNSNNKNRLLTDKMNGTTVFKIPDELWDRSYPMFCVELLGPNIKLECRPHGFTEEDVPVYTRTGKVANKLPYPEDIVRYNSSIFFIPEYSINSVFKLTLIFRRISNFSLFFRFFQVFFFSNYFLLFSIFNFISNVVDFFLIFEIIFQVSRSFTSLEDRNLSLCLCQPYLHDRER